MQPGDFGKALATARFQSLERYGLTERELAVLEAGYFVAVDNVPFRQEYNDMPEPRSLLIADSVEAVRDLLPAALESVHEGIWEVVALNTGIVAYTGNVESSNTEKEGGTSRS